MKNRIFAIILTLVLCITGTLCSCKASSDALKNASSFADESIIQSSASQSSSYAEPSSSSSAANSSSAVSSAAKKEEPSANGSSVPTPTVQNSPEVTVEETIVTDEEIEEPIDSQPIEEIKFNNNHTAVAESDYYQFGILNSKEKALYKNIVDTVLQSNNVVDFSGLSASYDEAVSAFQKVLADYPQFFYISKSFMLVYSAQGTAVRAIVLLYTDGSVTDELDESLNLIQSADRAVINQKIALLKEKIESVIAKIPVETAEVLKEKMIHDFIAESVQYDYSAAEKSDTQENTLPHAFDLYGAAVNKAAVCEGYSKYFQYLCYSVGINSTQIIGISGGGNHMWNGVLLDKEWYHLDVTWDDSDSIIGYGYFNLTDTEISKDHTADSSVLAVPKCTSSVNSFKNTFAIYVDDINKAPSGYETRISNVIADKSKALYVYIEGYSPTSDSGKYTAYIRQYLIKPSSEFSLYLSSKGMALSTQIYTLGEYFILSFV